MPVVAQAVKSDGFTSVTDYEVVTETVFAAAGTYVKGNVMIVDTGTAPPTGRKAVWKVCSTANTGHGAVIAAESKTVPTGGALIKVYVSGRLNSTDHGIIADSGAIALDALVSTSATAGALGTATGTYGAAVGQSVIGICVDAFTASTADGAIILARSPWL